MTKDGQTLISNATDKFESPLDGKNKISLQPGGKDYQKLKNNLMCLLQQFAYQHQLSNVKTAPTIIPAIPAIIADAALGILAAPAVPALFMYTDEINILEVYSDKLLELYERPKE